MSEPSKFIPPKSKGKKIKLAEEPKPEIPKDLQDKWGACTATATAFNIMKNGHYQHAYMKAVEQSLGFLAKLHEQAVEDALTHPDAHLISELKEEVIREAEAGRIEGISSGKSAS